MSDAAYDMVGGSVSTETKAQGGYSQSHSRSFHFLRELTRPRACTDFILSPGDTLKTQCSLARCAAFGQLGGLHLNETSVPTHWQSQTCLGKNPPPPPPDAGFSCHIRGSSPHPLHTPSQEVWFLGAGLPFGSVPGWGRVSKGRNTKHIYDTSHV